MGLPRKGSDKKKKGSRKRKANVWDDAEPKDKRDDLSRATDAPKRRISRCKGSMMSQWQTQKVMERAKERKFFASVEEKKRWQREHYEETRARTFNAMYKSKDVVEAKGAAVKDKSGESGSSEDNDEEEEEEEEEGLLDGTTKSTLFDEFVNTFKKDATDVEEEAEYDDEVVVDGNGEDVEGEEEVTGEEDGEDGENEKERPECVAAVKEEIEKQIAAMAKDDEGAVEEVHEEEQEDPYRRRYLLSSFSEQDAKQFDAMSRKFTKIELPTVESEVYDVTYRNGADADMKGVAGVVTTPDVAVKKKPYVRSRLAVTWRQRGVDVETLFAKRSIERTLFQLMSVYTDVFFAGQTYENTATLRRLSAMHVLNHVLKARDTVTRNNERIKKHEAGKADEEEDREYRDQGFCRASVLVLLPLRSAAVAFVDQLLRLLPANMDTFHNKDRFFSEYGSPKGNEEDAVEDDGLKEWQRVFDEGNNDDCFQLGVSFSRKAVRFYSEYHHADIIIASPLGLRQQLGDEVAVLDDAETSADAKLSSDFLSTIEVCIVDSASLMMMQNLEHLRTVLRAANMQPKEAPNADFARVREWNLAFLASYFRQTVVFSHGVEPALNALMNKTCRNLSGVVKFVRRYDAADGTASISRVVPQVKQIFQRVDLEYSQRLTAADEVDLRFNYFKKHVFEPLLDRPRKNVLIFIPSYFDYVRVRNLFNDTMNKKLIRSVQCCEYTTNKQVSRARTAFFHGHCHVMLYTERFHFYHQYQIRGVRQLIWYGLPVMGDFYAEMMNMLPSSDTTRHSDDRFADPTDGKSSIALFSRLDLLRLQRIVGNKRAEHMCQPKAAKPTFLFC